MTISTLQRGNASNLLFPFITNKFWCLWALVQRRAISSHNFRSKVCSSKSSVNRIINSVYIVLIYMVSYIHIFSSVYCLQKMATRWKEKGSGFLAQSNFNSGSEWCECVSTVPTPAFVVVFVIFMPRKSWKLSNVIKVIPQWAKRNRTMKAVSVLLRQILCNVRPVSGEKQNCSGNLRFCLGRLGLGYCRKKKAKFDVLQLLECRQKNRDSTLHTRPLKQCLLELLPLVILHQKQEKSEHDV